MPFRVDVPEDGLIEIMTAHGNRSHFPRYKSLEAALIVIKFLIKKDLAAAADRKFDPQVSKEARRAFKQLSERSPYSGKK
jgi:hypothetical protein